MPDTEQTIKPALYFDSHRHACIRLRDIGNKTVFLGISDSKVKGKRAVDVHQLPTDKFDRAYKLEVTTTSLKSITEKWMGLSSLGVIITPAARHAFADIISQETQDMTTKTTTAKTEVTKKETAKKTDTPIADAAKATAAAAKKPAKTLPAVTPGPTAKDDAEKAVKAAEVIKKNQAADKAKKEPAKKEPAKKEPAKKEPAKKEPAKKVDLAPDDTRVGKRKPEDQAQKDKAKKPIVTLKHLVSTGAKKEPKVSNEDLPLANAVVVAAPPNSKLVVGKTLAGRDPEPHTSTNDKETTMPIKTATAKTTSKTSPAPKATAKAAPVKEVKKAASKTDRPKPGTKNTEIAGKKIKVNAKADLSLVREGTVRMALMKAVMASATVDEAVAKKVKRSDGEKMAVNATHVKMAVEYGFITLVG
jgi:hypothetical protein